MDINEEINARVFKVATALQFKLKEFHIGVRRAPLQEKDDDTKVIYEFTIHKEGSRDAMTAYTESWFDGTEALGTITVAIYTELKQRFEWAQPKQKA